MNIIERVVEFYYKYDAFQDSYLEPDQAMFLYTLMFNRGRLHICEANGELLGYGESWRISYEQFGRILCGHNLYADLEQEDITNGNLAYLANVTIHPNVRGTAVIRYLRNDFFTKNKDAEYFCGWAKRKKHQPVKVFTRQQAFNKWAKSKTLEEIHHGRN